MRTVQFTLLALAAFVAVLAGNYMLSRPGLWAGDREQRFNRAVDIVVSDLRSSLYDFSRNAGWAMDDAARALERRARRTAEAVEDANEGDAPFADALADIRQRGELVMATTNEPTTYFIGTDGPKGYEYELARGYAAHLGVDLEVEVYDSAAAVLDAVEAGDAHVGAAHLKTTPANELLASFGPTFLTAEERIVCEVDGVRLERIEDLEKVELVVPTGSPFVDTLKERERDGWPVKWREVDALTTQMLAAVADHRIDCTVADEQVFEVNRRYFPNLVSDMRLTEDRPIAWALPGDDPAISEKLSADIAKWLKTPETKVYLADVEDTYFAYYEEFDYVDLQRFRRAIEKRLPSYRRLFEEYGVDQDIDWRLLAAVAWQESRWNPDAVSPTGVRGMMMLTRITAKEVGIRDRTDVRQSVQGGAKYLARMRRSVPDDVEERDRWWFATASYNVGLGHVLDARALARKLDRDGTRWRHVREALPLLEDPKYYKQTRYGYARGTEPVRYVQRIRQFQDILEKRFPTGGPAQAEFMNAPDLEAPAEPADIAQADID